MSATLKEGGQTERPTLRLRDLYEAHGAFVCRSLRRLGVAEADLDDMLQEVFVVVHQHLASYEERGRARAWLYSICTRVAHSQRRRVQRRREDHTREAPDTDVPATQLLDVEDREAHALGQSLLARLPAEQRVVFELYEIEDLPMAEIAEAVGCPLQTAYSRLHTARRRIMTALLELNREGESP